MQEDLCRFQEVCTIRGSKTNGGIQLSMSKIYLQEKIWEELDEEWGAYNLVSAAPISVGQRWTQWLWRASSILWWTQYFRRNTLVDTIFLTWYFEHKSLVTILWLWKASVQTHTTTFNTLRIFRAWRACAPCAQTNTPTFNTLVCSYLSRAIWTTS